MRRRTNLLCIAFALLFIATAAFGQSLITRYVAGEHYQVIDPPMPQGKNEKIHVVEFFLYSCPHCYHLEPELNAWRARLGDDVVFSRLPVLFGGSGEAYARLYYTAKQIGVLDRVHDDIFTAIHEQGRALASESDMRKFMQAHGVNGERFSATFNSDAVTEKVRQAGETMRAFQVTATPSLGVAGRYYVSGRTAGSNEKMFDVADYLIAKQRSGDDD